MILKKNKSFWWCPQKNGFCPTGGGLKKLRTCPHLLCFLCLPLQIISTNIIKFLRSYLTTIAYQLFELLLKLSSSLSLTGIQPSISKWHLSPSTIKKRLPSISATHRYINLDNLSIDNLSQVDYLWCDLKKVVLAQVLIQFGNEFVREGVNKKNWKNWGKIWSPARQLAENRFFCIHSYKKYVSFYQLYIYGCISE